ncbi:MAG: LysR family transcriptional regulator [Nitrococcus mobilis]|nr:LysR family transcriptional regulator [Nitrococcus mobilis]
MHVTLRQLKVFEAVARNLSYTRASEELHLTQPAVSIQIRQLEDKIGLPLFEQLGKRIFLTEAGRELHRHSKAIGRQLLEAEEAFAELKGLGRGRLAVSVASTAGFFATRLLADFCHLHEGITLSLEITNRQTLLARLDANETDIVIMGRPPAELELIGESFMDNPLVVIASPGHPLTQRRQIPLAELVKEPFVVREEASGTRRAMEKFFAEQKVVLRTTMQMTSNEAIKWAVMAGLGLGIVSVHTLELEVAGGQLAILDVQSFPIVRRWYVVHHQGKRLSPIAGTFKDYVLERAPRVWGRRYGVGCEQAGEGVNA